MNNKIKNYVDVLFSDIPKNKKANELKEELLSNMNERFQDYRQEGKSENQAYSLVVSNLGDVDALLEEVMPDKNFSKQAYAFRKRKARNVTVSVSLYIVGVILLIGVSSLGELLLGETEILGIVGLLLMLSCAAVATGLLIYTEMSTPPEFKEYDADEQENKELYQGKKGNLYRAVSSVYWMLIVLIYLTLSFFTGLWNFTWIIWPLSGILFAIFETILKLTGEKNDT